MRVCGTLASQARTPINQRYPHHCSSSHLQFSMRALSFGALFLAEEGQLGLQLVGEANGRVRLGAVDSCSLGRLVAGAASASVMLLGARHALGLLGDDVDVQSVRGLGAHVADVAGA